MINNRFLSIFMVAIVLFGSCTSKKQKEQTITISGAFALYPLVVQWADEYKKENPEVRFNISGGGAGKGMADALSGSVDLGMVSRKIADEEINQGAWFVGLTIDAVVPTLSSNNPYLAKIQQRGLTREELTKIFMKNDIINWSFLDSNSKNGLTAYTRSDACGAADTWAEYLGGKQENIAGVGIFGDPALAEAVIKDPFGVGFNNTIFVYDIQTGLKRPGIDVAPIDLNGNGIIDTDENFYSTFEEILNAIATGKYPSPPARELYFVSKGKPIKESVVKFIDWTLHDGQKFIKSAGYVPISPEKINEYILKLK